MRIVIPDYEVTTSTPYRIELSAGRLTLFTSTGESYVISQHGDGTLRIEAPGGALKMDVVSSAPPVARLTAQGSCQPCAARLSRGLEGPCETHKARTGKGPRIIKSPPPRNVTCEACGSTIEYEPEDLFRESTLPFSDDVGRIAVKCPKLRCKGHGYPR